MVENNRWGNLFAHLVLILGVAIVVFPVYVAVIASTHPPGTFVRGVMPLLPGPNALENYMTAITQGRSQAGTPPISGMLWNSFCDGHGHHRWQVVNFAALGLLPSSISAFRSASSSSGSFS